MEFMKCTGLSTVVIEELSDEEGDVMTITCKPRKRKGLLAIKGPLDNKEVSVQEEWIVMCSDDGLQDVQVDVEGEGEHGDTFFDVPVDFEGDQEESDEEDPEEDSGFVKSNYGSDEDNPNFAKYDVIQEAHEVQYEQITGSQSEKMKKKTNLIEQ
ncbi:hypothetical protein D8674_013699 [Pyrus ussuriensis x Pyrus communis]|uniref:Uncharacterized protein n=1 Tax=Pyrus ussuriensis x Pyrus communis TaxID=2448454 RepID=A0A5N5GXI5_9ROSA|nr:hypothetical protein D8674_013699 [Pyrus ussuriensis x Pyrus communis]